MKQKFISLGLALAMLLGVAGCNITTPATVGTIGGVEIPAGIYLLAQYNAYNTTAGLVDFATGESADDTGVVLNAEVTGTINGEEVTTDGADYISRLTMASIEYYAAAEKLFDELGATLEDAATAEAASSASSMWGSRPAVSASPPATSTRPTASPSPRWRPIFSTPPRPRPVCRCCTARTASSR